ARQIHLEIVAVRILYERLFDDDTFVEAIASEYLADRLDRLPVNRDGKLQPLASARFSLAHNSPVLLSPTLSLSVRPRTVAARPTIVCSTIAFSTVAPSSRIASRTTASRTVAPGPILA